MILLIDNYDSFTYNLVHMVADVGAECLVRRNDAITVAEAIAARPEAIILSPGPCDPDRAGVCLALTEAAAAAGTPLFGVCLGHQTIGQAFGGVVVRAPTPMHGKISPIHHRGEGVFRGIPAPFAATRYHSLTIASNSVPECLSVTARTDDGLVMGLSHRSAPIHGVQFHPESIASEHGRTMVKNFFEIAGLLR